MNETAFERLISLINSMEQGMYVQEDRLYEARDAALKDYSEMRLRLAALHSEKGDLEDRLAGRSAWS